MIKKIWPYLLFGLILRLILIPTTLHPDIRGFNLGAYLISQKGQFFGFYDYISKLPRTDPLVKLYGDDLFIYPPLAYQTHALFMKLLGPLYPWDVFHTLISDIGRARFLPGMPFLLYLLKLPYLVADVVCLYIISRLPGLSNRKLPLILWWFNPVTIYASYMVSQFDIFIALFLLLALYLRQKKHSFLSAITLGIAAGFKPFPLFFLPFIPEQPGLLPRLKTMAIGIVTYVLIISPYLSSPAFKQYALLANQTDKLIYARIMVSGSQYLSLFYLGLIVLLWWNLSNPLAMSLPGWFSALPLLFYSVSHYHPQWFVWGSPFLILSAVTKPAARWPVILLLMCYTVVVLLFEPSLNFGLFNINFDFSRFISTFFPADQLASMVRSVFAGTSVWLIYLLSQKENPVGS